MKTSTLLAALLATAALAAPATAQDTSKKENKDDYDIRFLCPSANLRPKYEKDSRGNLIRIRATQDEIPPQMIYIKKGPKDDIPIQLVADGVSDSFRIPAKSLGGGPLEIESAVIEFSVNKDAKGADDQAVATIVKRPLAKIEVAPGKPSLVCFYQPDTHGKWLPPKQLVADLSTEKFPADSVLILNLSSAAAVAAVGEQGKILEVPAGGQIVITPKPATTGLHMAKIASKTKAGGYAVLLNSESEIPAGKRAVAVISPANPAANAGLTEHVVWQILKEAPPPEDKKARK